MIATELMRAELLLADAAVPSSRKIVDIPKAKALWSSNAAAPHHTAAVILMYRNGVWLLIPEDSFAVANIPTLIGLMMTAICWRQCVQMHITLSRR